jgi:hypothetical protein
VGNLKYFQIILKTSGPVLGYDLLYKEQLQFRDCAYPKRNLEMSKLALTLIASLFAVSAFAADAAKAEVKATPVATAVAAPAPTATATPAKKAAKHHKSHAAKAVKPAAKASAPVAAAK